MSRLLRIPALCLALVVTCLAGAWAAGNFTVANVHVDASGSSATEARAAAVARGRPIAWQMLFRRLTRQQDWARQPVLDDAQLQKIIVGYLPMDERRSTTRYVADITYTFNPEAVARVLQGGGIPYATATSRRVLLIPMAPGYSRGSMWTTAFSSPRFATSAVPFAVPVGDAQDTAALGGLNFDTATWENVAPVAARVRASEAVLVRAAVNGRKLTINLKRVGASEIPARSTIEVPLVQGAPSTYPTAADAAVRALDELWKTQKAVDYSQRAKLVADVRVESLAQLTNLQNMVASVPNVANVGVAAIDLGQARLSISYIGSTEQLREALAQAGVTLVKSGGTWQLSGGAAANAGQP